MKMPEINEDFIIAARRFYVAFGCGVVVTALGVTVRVESVNPIPHQKIVDCQRAIGKRALFRDQRPKPQCAGQLGQFLTERAPGREPTTAQAFDMQANSYNDDLNYDGDAVDVLTVIGVGVAAAGGYKIYDHRRTLGR
jgi:hypothetical protein